MKIVNKLKKEKKWHATSYLKLSMEVYGPCSVWFYKALSIVTSEIDSDYRKINKEDFIEYARKLKYSELRCEQMYIRLKEIEVEFEELIQ